MPQENSASPPTSITVGQLVYTSFKSFGFQMLTSPSTLSVIRNSFEEKIVNARWDPHSPPSSDYRAVYLYQAIADPSYTVLGWLYYDGHDDFGRSGVPYFLAYYHLGIPTREHLEIFFDHLGKGPAQSISRQIHAQPDLPTVTLKLDLNYEADRSGVVIPDAIRTQSIEALVAQQPIDWFISQTSDDASENNGIVIHEPVPDIALPVSSEDASDLAEEDNLTEEVVSDLAGALVKPNDEPSAPPLSSQALVPKPSTGTIEKIEVILTEFINKTMGIQGAALVSEEGHPIVSSIDLDDNALGMIAGSMLYMIQTTHQELNWPACELVTLKGPRNYLMLSAFQSGVYLLVKSAKVPMGLLETIVKRMSNKLKAELDNFELESSPDQSPSLNDDPEPLDTATEPPLSTGNIPALLRSVLGDETPNNSALQPPDDEIDFDEDITYRGRPTSS